MGDVAHRIDLERVAILAAVMWMDLDPNQRAGVVLLCILIGIMAIIAFEVCALLSQL